MMEERGAGRRSAMAAGAVFLVFYIEGLLTVMAFAAKFALGDLAHVHFVRAVGHLEDLVVAAGAFQAATVHVLIVAEQYGRRIFRREGKVSSSDFLGEGSIRDGDECDGGEKNQQFFHDIFPPIGRMRRGMMLLLICERHYSNTYIIDQDVFALVPAGSNTVRKANE
jgi:hypothetical protein